MKSSTASCKTNPMDVKLTDDEIKVGEKEKKKAERTRKRTHLEPRIKILRFVAKGDGSEEAGDEESQKKDGVKVEFEMKTLKGTTITFEVHSADIGPEEMANTFISEDLLAEKHRQIFVEQLVDIARQLREDPATLPQAIHNEPVPAHDNSEGSGEQQEDKKDETSTVPSPPSEVESGRTMGGAVKIEVPCVSSPLEDIQKTRTQLMEEAESAMRTLGDVLTTLFLVSYLLVLNGMLWMKEMDCKSVSLLRSGMTTMSAVFFMFIVGKLSLYFKWNPYMKWITMAPFMAIYIVANYDAFLQNGLPRLTNNKHLYVVAVEFPIMVWVVPIVRIIWNCCGSHTSGERAHRYATFLCSCDVDSLLRQLTTGEPNKAESACCHGKISILDTNQGSA